VAGAAEPNKSDVSLHVIGKPPNCQFDDGELQMSNSSGEYHYKITATITIENDRATLAVRPTHPTATTRYAHSA